MRRSARFLFLLCIAGGFIALFSRIGPSRRPAGEEGEGARPETAEDLVVDNLHYAEWKGEELVWVLDARLGKYYHDGSEARLKDVKVTFLSSSGRKVFLEADDVVYAVETGNLVARGDVRGRTGDGIRFTTTTLSFDGETREVRTADKVTLEKDRLTIVGVGMKGSLERRRFVLLSSVRAVFSPRGTGP